MAVLVHSERIKPFASAIGMVAEKFNRHRQRQLTADLRQHPREKGEFLFNDIVPA